MTHRATYYLISYPGTGWTSVERHGGSLPWRRRRHGPDGREVFGSLTAYRTFGEASWGVPRARWLTARPPTAAEWDELHQAAIEALALARHRPSPATAATWSAVLARVLELTPGFRELSPENAAALEAEAEAWFATVAP